MIGYWETEAPLSPEQVREDQPILQSLLQDVPKGAVIRRCEAWVNGRLYEWHRIDTRGLNE